MAFTLGIITTTALVESDGSIGQIFSIRWQSTKVDNDTTVHQQGITNVPSSYVPAQIPYNTVTEADAIAWIRDLDNEAAIEAKLDAKLDLRYEQPVTEGLPWKQEDTQDVWVIGVAYAVDHVVSYVLQSVKLYYKCTRAHTSTRALVPPRNPAIWTQVRG